LAFTLRKSWLRTASRYWWARAIANGKAAAAEIGKHAVAIQLDITDKASNAAAVEGIRSEFSRLDLLIKKCRHFHGEAQRRSLQNYATVGISVVSVDKVKKVWDTNVFGGLAVY